MRSRGTVAFALLLAVGCERGGASTGRVETVERADLVLSVEVTGTLISLDSEPVGPPARWRPVKWCLKVIEF